jgi:hypothetical protein
VDEMTEEIYPVTPVEIIEWVVRADPNEPPPVIQGPITDASLSEPHPAADELAHLLQEAIEHHPAIQIRRGSQPIAYWAWAAELLARLAKENR